MTAVSSKEKKINYDNWARTLFSDVPKDPEMEWPKAELCTRNAKPKTFCYYLLLLPKPFPNLDMLMLVRFRMTGIW